MAKIQLATDLTSYFEHEVNSTASKQGVDLSPFAKSYLANLLLRFSQTNNYLLKHLENGEAKDANGFPRLGVLWLEGLTKSGGEQMVQMQSLGDFALFTTGFFSERIQATSVDMDYYTALGGRAYERAGQIRETLSSEKAINTFFELADTFEKVTEIFAELSDQKLLGSDADMLKLYQKWLQTGSYRIARMLGEKGIIVRRGSGDPESRD